MNKLNLLILAALLGFPGSAVAQSTQSAETKAPPLWKGEGGEVSSRHVDERGVGPGVEEKTFCPLPVGEPVRLLRSIRSLVARADLSGAFDAGAVYIQQANDDGVRGLQTSSGSPVPDRWFVIDEDADCGKGQIAVRTRTFRNENSAGSLEEAYYEDFTDSKGVTCLNTSDARRLLRKTVIPVNPEIKHYEGFKRRWYTALPLDDAEEVSFSPYDEGDMYRNDKASNVYLRKFVGTHPACTDQVCTVAQFEGPLYSECGCRPQGFTLLLDAEGRVVEFLSSTLRFGRIHQTIPADHPPDGWPDDTPTLQRIQELLNDKGKLTQAYAYDPAKGEYLGASSLASSENSKLHYVGAGAGVTVAATLVITSKIRERLLGTENGWPVYDKPQPH